MNKQKQHEKIIELISTIGNSFGGSEIVYTQGSCYQFYKILKQVYPDAKPYHNGNHVITKIDEVYYDINGVYVEGLYNYILMTEDDEKDAESWIYNVKYPVFLHCFDLNEQEMTSFINYESEKELAQSLYSMYGYKRNITFGMDAEEICEVLNFSIKTTYKKI